VANLELSNKEQNHQEMQEKTREDKPKRLFPKASISL